MDYLDLAIIQNKINYTFKNQTLLKQAFIRSSFANENGTEGNEVLEFIGDTALDAVVVKMFADSFGEIEDNKQYSCQKDEGAMTDLKSRLVEKKNLSKCIDRLKLADYLILGVRDARNNAQMSASVKEDLFEAIIGAVALDSNWDLEALQKTVECMLQPKEMMEGEIEKNYVNLVQTWVQKKTGKVPEMVFHNYHSKYDMHSLAFECEVKVSPINKSFSGYGRTKKDAKKNANKNAYQYLVNNGYIGLVKNEVEDMTVTDAVSKLQILAQRGYVNEPKYNYEQTYDKDGNPVFVCVCTLKEYGWFYSREHSAKKDAKKDAAEKALEYMYREKKHLGEI